MPILNQCKLSQKYPNAVKLMTTNVIKAVHKARPACLAQVQVLYSLFIKACLANHPLVLVGTLMYKGRALDAQPALLVRLAQQWGLYGAPLSPSVAREMCQGSAFNGEVTETPAVSLVFVGAKRMP